MSRYHDLSLRRLFTLFLVVFIRLFSFLQLVCFSVVEDLVRV